MGNNDHLEHEEGSMGSFDKTEKVNALKTENLELSEQVADQQAAARKDWKHIEELETNLDAWKAEAKRLITKVAEVTKEYGWLKEKLDTLIVERDALVDACEIMLPNYINTPWYDNRVVKVVETAIRKKAENG